MLESISSCPASYCSHIVHTPNEFTSLIAKLNYITYIVSKLKAKLAKIMAELKEIRKQLSVTNLAVPTRSVIVKKI